MTLLLVVALLLTAGVLWYGLLSWQRILHRHREQQPGTDEERSALARADRPDPTADVPSHWPAAATWIAVRAADSDAVVRALALRTVLPANWRSGFEAAAVAGVFVTPPVDGWVLACGVELLAGGEPVDAVPALLEALSRTFGRAAWFCRDDGRETYGWAVAERGVLVRGYAYAGEHGHVFWRGDVTADEHALGCFVDDPRDQSDDDVKWWPDARFVGALAVAWSVEPEAWIRRARSPGVGRFGRR